MEDMRYACDGARSHMLRRVPKQPSLSALYTLSSHATHEAVHLLCQMLVFDPVSLTTLLSRKNRKIITINFFYRYAIYRTREYQLLMHSLIPISTKAVYVTIRACANAVTTPRAEWDNTRLILSLQRRNHLTIFGNVSWHRCNKWKVRKTINCTLRRRQPCWVGQSWMDFFFCDALLFAPAGRNLQYCCVFNYFILSCILSLIRTEEMHKFIAEQLQTGRVPLCINPQSAAFKSFARWVDALHNPCFPILFFPFFSLLFIIFLFSSISSSYKYYYFFVFCFESRNDIWN